ncbi:hypothetical protein SESBI_22683 [Sesbania bispinosa]|nr:hypothetical protein SESBI_22683 [Sesbania bispinosa]
MPLMYILVIFWVKLQYPAHMNKDLTQRMGGKEGVTKSNNHEINGSQVAPPPVAPCTQVLSNGATPSNVFSYQNIH